MLQMRGMNVTDEGAEHCSCGSPAPICLDLPTVAFLLACFFGMNPHSMSAGVWQGALGHPGPWGQPSGR